jgi:hypothetical protein
MDEERTTLSDSQIMTGEPGEAPSAEIMDADETDADTDTTDTDDADDTDTDSDDTDAHSDPIDLS